ncbi:MAG: hypothetical protein JXI43_14460 [Tissierellales bacterium]|nr:hypothetical protein [Tissierellales bacterium]
MDEPIRSYGTVLWVIAGLLAALLLVAAFSIWTTYQQNAIAKERAESYQARVDEAQAVVEQQRDMITDLTSDYQSAAYDNPAIDRIAEQQLLAAEYQLLALQTLAIQNTQVIELLSAAP